jgi:hypothetical protein
MISPGRRSSVVGVLYVVLVGGVSRGETAPPAGILAGTVVDRTPDCTPEKCALLANSKTDEDTRRILREMLGPRPAGGVIVTAASSQRKWEVVSDARGNFVFTDLPLGPYTVSAATPASPAGQEGKRKVSAGKGVECGQGVRLVLHEELITVSGRITDSQGQPIAHAQVTGTLVPISEVGLPEMRVAVSNDEGFYTLVGLEPVNVYRVAGYLNGGSLEAVGALQTQAEIKVEAPGFRQDKANVPKVPLISETQLVPARRLWKAVAEYAARTGQEDNWQEMKKPPLPASRGSTLTGVDIVLVPE